MFSKTEIAKLASLYATLQDGVLMLERLDSLVETLADLSDDGWTAERQAASGKLSNITRHIAIARDEILSLATAK